ncbi:E3 SUMO-protein ligase NSE2-like [Actinia tenebrosa]|uniref:E3 SUMO-protein ligase NSE2 n=1 Tax=Actinia tenebrosa TaxID=6105 RepID=A0A6P8IJL4_ACTTE|nr:E3 SUMO-protein ligase NSE2-like [Actinia tenebrosa]
MPVHFNTVDNAATKLQKVKEFIDNGMGATLDVALDIEERKEGSEQVKELHDAMVQYAQMEREVGQWMEALDKTKAEFSKLNSSSNDEVPDIEAIFNDKLAALEAKNTNSDLMDHKKVKNFQSQIWKVHHEGQPLPSQSDDADKVAEDADLIMSQATERTTCPITTVEMKKPMRHKKCGHNYEKEAIIQHIKRAVSKGRAKCPIAGCVHFVTKNDLEPNTELERIISRKNRKK